MDKHDEQEPTVKTGGVDALRAVAASLESVISTRSDDERAWAREVKRAVSRASTVLEGHRVTNEGPDGLLPPIVDTKPGLLPEVAEREREHAQMLHAAEELRTVIDRQLAADDVQPDMIRLQASVLQQCLGLHLARTNALAADAYLRQEGGEG